MVILLKRWEFSSCKEVFDTIAARDENEERRVVACFVAGQLQRHEALGALLIALEDCSERVSFSAGSALSAIKSHKVTRKLIQVIRCSPREHNRYASICALFGAPDRRTRQILLAVVKGHGDPQTRSLAAEVLGQLTPTPRSTDALLDALHDGEASVRFGALCGLGGFASPPTGVIERGVEALCNDTARGVGQETIGQRASLLLKEMRSLRKLFGGS